VTSKRQRSFAAFGAILFLITSSALTITVIVLSSQSSNSSGSSTNSSTSLAGTKLAGFTPTSVPLTKLETTDQKVGTGAVVKPGDTITADYVGALMKTGIIFDASVDHGGPQTFSLGQVIPGWQEGIPGMKVGGTRQLLIPAALAYGSAGTSGIPANSDLIFNVTVTKIDN
jgi:FKBP-type peptidyl-prolyl cis-trans isomerase